MAVLSSIGKCLAALMLGIMAPGLIWVGVGSAAYSYQKRSRTMRSVRTCAVDADCPGGFVCSNGRCVPAR